MGPRAALDLAELLCNVGLEAMDILVNFLAESKSLSSVRLACRGVRDAVDASVQKLHLAVRKDPYNGGEFPQLERWPRCTSMSITIDEGAARTMDGRKATSLLVLPFERLNAQHRSRFTRLYVDIKGLESLEAAALSPIAIWLPTLREVRLHQLHLAGDPLQLASMYKALATLRHLEILSVPNCRALEGIDALGGRGSRLSRLEVWNTGKGSCDGVTTQALLGLSLLTSLKTLRYVDFRHGTGAFDPAPAMHLLAADLPPSLELLVLEGVVAPDCCTLHIDIAFKHRRPHSIIVDTVMELRNLLTYVGCMILPSLAPGHQLESMTLKILEVPSCVRVGEQDSALLLALRQRCRHLCVEQLSLPGCADSVARLEQLDAAWQAIEALGHPQTLALQVTACVASSGGLQQGDRSVIIRLAGSQSPEPTTGRAGASVAAAQRDWPFLASIGATIGAAGGGAGVSGGTGPQVELLVLRGLFVESLFRMPEAVEPWVAALARQAAIIGGHGSFACPSGTQVNRPQCIHAFQAVPCSGSLLLASDVRARRAVATAVARAAARCNSTAPTAALEMKVLGAQWTWGVLDEGSAPGGPLQDWLIDSVAQELQAQSHAAGSDGNGSGTHRRRLWTAMSVRDMLTQRLPPAVFL